MSFAQLTIPEKTIEAAQKGRRDALETILRAFEPLAYYTALTILKDEESARDTAQEALLKIARNIGGFEGRSKLSTWGYRIIRNAVTDTLRQRREPALELTEENAGASPVHTDKEIEARESWRLLAGALEILSPERREIVVLFDLQGYSFREIAELLGMPEGSVKSKWSRARNELRGHFVAKNLLSVEPIGESARQKK